jgi:proteasome lid subunit RPN8/RPN11
MHRRAYRAQQLDHLEVCGVLAADDDNRIRLIFLPNKSQKAYEYELDRKAILAIMRTSLSDGMRAIGTFHSHPVGYALPSQGDLKKGFFRGVELIYDVCGREFKLWRLRTRGHRRIATELILISEPQRARRWGPLPESVGLHGARGVSMEV